MLLKPFVYFIIHFSEESSFQTDCWLSLNDKEIVSNCDINFGFKLN